MSVKGVVYVHEAYEAKNKNLLCEHITPTKFLYIYIYSTPIVAYAHTMFVTFCAINVPASASCARPSILGTRVRSQGGIVSMFGHYMQGAGKLPLGAGCCQADPCPSNASIVRRRCFEPQQCWLHATAGPAVALALQDCSKDRRHVDRTRIDRVKS